MPTHFCWDQNNRFWDFSIFRFFCQIRHFLQLYVAVASWVFTETSRNLHIIRPNRSALCLQFFVEIKIIVFEIFGFFMFLPKFVIFEKKFFSNLCGSGLCYRTTVLKYLNSPTCPHATIVFTDIHKYGQIFEIRFFRQGARSNARIFMKLSEKMRMVIRKVLTKFG